MEATLTYEVEVRAQVLTALAEPIRMAMVDHLVLGDASPSELGAEVGLGSNLLAHHLRILEGAGIIRRARSEGDRRRSYVQLRSDHPIVRAAALTGRARIGQAFTEQARNGEAGSGQAAVSEPRIVFVCTANSARSQLAAASWNQLSTIPATSAGTHPGPRIHPRAVSTGRRHGLTLSNARPVGLNDQLRDGDLVVAVCDNAHEELDPSLQRLHWSIPDPVRVDTDPAFEAAYDDITHRVHHLSAVLGETERAS